MPIQIQIKDEHIKYVTEGYTIQLRAVREKKSLLEDEEKELMEIIRELHSIYNSQPELFNYAQALDNYIDQLEEVNATPTQQEENG